MDATREQQMRRNFQMMADGSEPWESVKEVLDHNIEVETIQSVDPGLNDAERHFYAGRLASLKALRMLFDKLRQGEPTQKLENP